MLPTPYTPGETPRVLAGRDDELTLIRDRLARVEAYGEYGGPMMVFHAPRGLGKTSLLRSAEEFAISRGFVSVWLSCPKRAPLLPEVLHGVDRALAATDSVPAHVWRPRLERIGVELGLPGLKVRADVDPDTPHEPERPRPPARVGAVQDLLHGAADAVRRHGGAGVLLQLDELHAAPQPDLAVLLNALQNLSGDRARNPLLVLGAGLPSTPGALTRAATFGERSTFVSLDRLAASDAAYAVVEPARRLEVGWADDAVAAVVRIADGYPYFVQLLAGAAWAAARPSTGATVRHEHVTAGLRRAREQMAAIYRARWDAATEGEQAFLAAMALLAEESPTVARSDLAGALGQESSALSVPRNRLIDKGVIEPAGHGLLQFTLPGFGPYVVALAGDGADEVVPGFPGERDD